MKPPSLVKAFALLEATATEPAGRSLAALATEVGLPKPTAHRILKALAEMGYLERTSLGVYRQTPKVWQLVSNDRAERLMAIAEPLLRQLHAVTQETVNLGVLRGDRVVYLQVLESTQPLRRVATPNSADPFHTTALGRAIASHLPADERAALVARATFEQRTPHTTMSPDAVEAILDQAAGDGYALEVDETDLGVTCVGAPILHEGLAVAAVSISVPSARATGELLNDIIVQLRRIAKHISQQLSCDKTTNQTLSAKAL
jgi:DNA-binding IclR family transcriptional regulator